MRIASVEICDALQAPQNIAQMTAKNAAIGVQLIDHHVAQIFEQALPLGVVRQDAGVQHVRIGEHDVAFFADGFARVARRCRRRK